MTKKDEESFWDEGSFVESMSQGEFEKKKDTIHKKHDEDMNYNCKKCDKKYPPTTGTGMPDYAITASIKSLTRIYSSSPFKEPFCQ